MKKTFCFVIAFVYIVLTSAFWAGLVVSLNGLSPDYVPDDNALYCFGIGLCALPALLLTSGCFAFYNELAMALRSKDDQKNTGLP